MQRLYFFYIAQCYLILVNTMVLTSQIPINAAMLLFNCMYNLLLNLISFFLSSIAAMPH